MNGSLPVWPHGERTAGCRAYETGVATRHWWDSVPA
jgi:hypothetical protein